MAAAKKESAQSSPEIKSNHALANKIVEESAAATMNEDPDNLSRKEKFLIQMEIAS